MKKFSIALLALAVALAITPSALASTFINGSLGVTGGNDSWNGTSVTFNTPSGTVTDNSGNFGIIPLTTPTTINSTTLTFATPDVLVLTTSGGDATFTIVGPLNIIYDASDGLLFNGDGTLTLTGFAPTEGLVSFSSNVSGASTGWTFEISANGAPPPVIPEPGTMTLLGTGLLGLAGMLRSKFGKAR
ncbi:MAG TPA: PEP-CTERM sorting domain-containing protein [Terracidiphilus sp.]|jgi:hypothetical protein